MRSTPELDDRASAVAIDEDDDTLFDEPRQRLSFSRLGIVLVVAALLAGAVVFGIDKISTGHEVLERSWSVPYVDVTLTPTYEFQNPESNPARDIALAFIVADPKSKCSPSWGESYSMDAAKEAIELDRRITQLRAAGGDIMISFGGQANAELAVACTDVSALTDAYRSVIDRYNPQVIDLDIEGSAVADAASVQRRAAAIAAIQKERAAAKHPLAVWLTVPVTSSGLAADAVSLVTSTIKGGVALTGVNVMTMNFGSPGHPTADMLGTTKSALEGAAKQLAAIYAAQGVTLDESQRWAHLGATPMIGQNDVEGEVFTVDDAKGLAGFAMSKGLGRVSLWSLNRDTPCSTSFADVMVLSNACSSVKQDPLGFASVFTTLPGRAAYLPQSDSVTMNNRQQIVDDPTKSPYPLWRPEAQYPEGYKVVRHGLVYQAKWYTQGQEPTLVTANPWDTPWSLVGPVSADDKPFTPTTMAPGTYPDWNPDHLYAKGDRVLLEGLPYEARWPNQAEVPQTLLPVATDSAWSPLFTVPGEPASS